MLDKKLLLNDLAELLEEPVETLNDDYYLDPNGLWDSLTFVSTIAAISQHYQIPIKGSDIEGCKTIGELFSVVEEKVETKTSAIV